MSLITLREIVVNINELRLLHHRERIKQKLNVLRIADKTQWPLLILTCPLNLPSQWPLNMYLERVVVYDIGLRQPSDKPVVGCVYDQFDWPVIRRGHQFGVMGVSVIGSKTKSSSSSNCSCNRNMT